MKRFNLALVIGLTLVLLGAFCFSAMIPAFAVDVNSDTESSSVTVTVPNYVSVDGLGQFGFTLIFAGGPPATGTGSNFDDFNVNANVNTVVSVTEAVEGLSTYLTPTLLATSNTPAVTANRLTVAAAGVPLSVAPADYSTTYTVTATKNP